MKLALAIPTFRRPDALRGNLIAIADEAAALGVGIYISDDSDDELTSGMVRDLLDRYPNIVYRKNTPPLRHDGNLIATLTWPPADYVWLLSDSLRIERGRLAQILELLGDEDFMFVNSHSPYADTRRNVAGADAKELIAERLWHQTMTGATIYSRNVVEWVRSSQPRIFSNFPQLSVILGYAAGTSPVITWFGPKALSSVHKTSYWRNAVFDVFVDDWARVVAAFPSVIGPGRVPAVIKSHSKMTNLFNLDYLVELKQSSQLGWRRLFHARFWQAMHVSKLKLLAIMLLPTAMTRGLVQLRKLQHSRTP